MTTLFVLPFPRFYLIARINALLVRFQLMRLIGRARIIWLTFPTWFEPIEHILPTDAFLVYDCMDDALEFSDIKSRASNRERLLELEAKLVKRCNVIFTSSENLKHTLIKRYGNRDIQVINNGIHLADQSAARENGCEKIMARLHEILPQCAAKKKLMYLGTISEWLDTGLILASLDKYCDIVYLFIGPVDVRLPAHDRIIQVPPVKHQYIYWLMEQADALVMPFKINNLIRSVDPVKMYEYIYSGKPVISIEYGEILKFKEYIHTYNSHDDYHHLIEKLLLNTLSPKKELEEAIAYVSKHTWHVRAQEIRQIIGEKFSSKGSGRFGRPLT